MRIFPKQRTNRFWAFWLWLESFPVKIEKIRKIQIVILVKLVTNETRIDTHVCINKPLLSVKFLLSQSFADKIILNGQKKVLNNFSFFPPIVNCSVYFRRRIFQLNQLLNVNSKRMGRNMKANKLTIKVYVEYL